MNGINDRKGVSVDESQFIQQLGGELGLPDLQFSEDLTARLVVGEDVVVDLEWNADTQTLHIYSALGHVGEENAGLMREMLSANLFGVGTTGAVLAIDDAQREVVLCREFETETLDVPRFAGQLKSFVERAAYWTERVASVSHSEDEDNAAVPDVPTGTDILRP